MLILNNLGLVVARFPTRSMPLKIARLNIGRRLPHLLAWRGVTKPYVVCRQEFKAEQRAFSAGALREVGYGAVWQGERSWNGAAILARGRGPVLTHRALSGS